MRLAGHVLTGHLEEQNLGVNQPGLRCPPSPPALLPIPFLYPGRVDRVEGEGPGFVGQRQSLASVTALDPAQEP